MKFIFFGLAHKYCHADITRMFLTLCQNFDELSLFRQNESEMKYVINDGSARSKEAMVLKFGYLQSLEREGSSTISRALQREAELFCFRSRRIRGVKSHECAEIDFNFFSEGMIPLMYRKYLNICRDSKG